MAIPEFVLALRAKVGTDPLWLAGVTAVVVRGDEILLVRRADNGAWTPVTGIIDPGEEPADSAVREVLEEAGVHAVPQRLAAVGVTDPVRYDNGDQAQYLDLTFLMSWSSGEPHPADGENTAAEWFALGQLPPMATEMTERIDAALSGRTEARFLVASESAGRERVRRASGAASAVHGLALTANTGAERNRASCPTR